MDNIKKIVTATLAEDIGTGDVSSALLTDKNINAIIKTRENAIMCGIEYAQQVFKQVNNSITLKWQVKDGDKISAGQNICLLSGSAKSILSAERSALNLLQTLSATATQTNYLVNKIAHTKAQILDTRKTIPGLRVAQKYAVKCGGGVNHRQGLYDCIMIKENHISALGSIDNAVNLAKNKYPNLDLIVEVENLKQLSATIQLSGITRILCDNFTILDLVEAVKMAKNKYKLEASGNITTDNITSYAETGVDYISIGAITKNICAIDLSLTFS